MYDAPFITIVFSVNGFMKCNCCQGSLQGAVSYTHLDVYKRQGVIDRPINIHKLISLEYVICHLGSMVINLTIITNAAVGNFNVCLFIIGNK